MTEQNAKHFSRTILILNLPDLRYLADISSPIKAAAARTQKHLLIVIFSPAFNSNGGTHWDAVQRLLTHAYVQAVGVSQEHNRILMNVDVLLRGSKEPPEDIPIDDWDIVFSPNGTKGLPVPHTWLSLPSMELSEGSLSATMSTTDTSDSDVAQYPVVALGGTFDHLHAGHKILLSMGAWIAKEKIIVGVTDDVLLKSKVHREHLESIDVRIESVRSFLRLFKPGLIYDIVPIHDVYGPTGWDPNIQALVVSKETIAGANAVASLRASKSLPTLETFIVDVISPSSSDLSGDPDVLKSTKISSTSIRQWIQDQKSLS